MVFSFTKISLEAPQEILEAPQEILEAPQENQIKFVFFSLICTSDFVESTFARENSNIIWFSSRLFVPLQAKLHTMADYIIIVAGGKGLRMGGDVPKQFMPIGGVPVLMRTLQRFREYSETLRIILVLPHEQQDYWRSLCQEHHFDVPYQLADGGETRFHSVQNGLKLIPDDEQGVVGVHDGVRPFVSVDVIARCYEAARTHGAVIPEVTLGTGTCHMKENYYKAEYDLILDSGISFLPQ